MKKIISIAAASFCVIAPFKAIAGAANPYINIKPGPGILVKSNGGSPIAITFSGDLNSKDMYSSNYAAECRVRQTGPKSIEYIPGGELVKTDGPLAYGGSMIPFPSDYQDMGDVFRFSVSVGVRHTTMYMINKRTMTYNAFDTRDGNETWKPRASTAFTSQAIMETGKALAQDLCGALVEYWPTIVEQYPNALIADQMCPKQPKGASREQTIKFCETQALYEYRNVGIVAPQ